MLILPFLVGLIYRTQAGGFDLVALPLFALWMVGYFAFNALSLWLKSNRQERYLKPAQVYGMATAGLGLLVLLLRPGLISWAPLYAPLLGIGLWRAAARDDSSLLSRWVTVIAACLFCAVTFSDGFHTFASQLGSNAEAMRVLKATLILLGYFLGTILYVKTMIRERGQRNWVVASTVFHAACMLIAALCAAQGALTWAVPAFFALVTVRAYAMPTFGPMRARRITPKQVGLTEFGISILLLLILLAVR